MSDDNDEIIQEFLTECNEHLDQLDQGFVAIEQNASDHKLLSAIFRSIHTIKGGAGMLAFNKLEKLAHAAESLLSLLRDNKLTLNTDMTTALLQTVDAIRHMLECITQTSQDGENDYLSLIETLKQLQTGQVNPVSNDKVEVVEENTSSGHPEQLDAEAIPSASAATTDAPEPEIECQPEPEPEPEPILEQTAHEDVTHDPSESDNALTQTITDNAQPSEFKGASSAEASIRINIELLDKLMNLVGELVLSRNQVLQCVSTQSDLNFIKVSQRLNLITSELQEGVMKTRMQPIGSVWSKFTRVVRDLSISCHKKVNLEMFGKETELDKTLIEAIKDPLIHIIRNSLDHGIETPEERLAAGKSEEGTLILNAFHEGGHVNIEISDDGRGISGEKVKNKALSKGLITAEQAARMSERDAINLIFLPGLSTAEQVTNVSGRGVGMDVVRTNIERINGSIDIQSKVGSSTSLKIKIPLTLAIIPALIVTSHQNRYAIPQVNLLELVRLEPEQIKQDITFVKDIPIYKLRGKLLPLVYLEKGLELNPENNTEKTDGAINIVVLQAGEIKFGLVVDNINDTQEIVVKPLSKLLRNLYVYSGATIMGDGKISLILDPVGLARKAGLLSFNAEANNLKNASQMYTEDGDRQTLLLLRSGEKNIMAVPLSNVDRIEEFSVKNIEYSGKQEVVQYRNSIMPLIRLAQCVNDEQEITNGLDKLQVIVCLRQEKNFGVVVDHIYDIVEGTFALQQHMSRPGVLGTAVVDGKVTEIIDVETIINTSLSHYVEQSAVV